MARSHQPVRFGVRILRGTAWHVAAERRCCGGDEGAESAPPHCCLAPCFCALLLRAHPVLVVAVKRLELLVLKQLVDLGKLAGPTPPTSAVLHRDACFRTYCCRSRSPTLVSKLL
jgi:hypothetical protein